MVERVLRAVEVIPDGRVASYGDVAALVGIGPRQVGSIMRQYGDGVRWWRVVSASGGLPPELLSNALPRWRMEGITLSAAGRGCRIREHRVEMTSWAADHARATSSLAV